MLMTSSCSDHDVIAIMIAVMVHGRQTLCMTGRPLHMTYRPWQMTGRPMSDLDALCNWQTFMHDIQTMVNERRTYV